MSGNSGRCSTVDRNNIAAGDRNNIAAGEGGGGGGRGRGGSAREQISKCQVVQ